MANWIPGRYVPRTTPGEDLSPDDMALVTEDDWLTIRTIARGYCRTVDATRSRKRMDGSATATRYGQPLYGTDDVSDDVTQDAVIIFAGRLRDISRDCPVHARTPELSWDYRRRDGETSVITRTTLYKWAVHDAARRNSDRLDVPPDDLDAAPGDQIMRGLPHAEMMGALAYGATVAQLGPEIFRMAWGDGTEYPTLQDLIPAGEQADDLKRESVLAKVAQRRYGGKRGSRRQVRRAVRNARVEWANLRARIDDVRDDLVYRAARQNG